MRPSCNLLDLRWTASLDHPDYDDAEDDDDVRCDLRGLGVGAQDYNNIDTANNGVLFLARYVDDFLVVATTADDSSALLTQFQLDSPGEGLTFTTSQEDPQDGTVDFLDLKLWIETGIDGEYFVSCGALVDKPRLRNLNAYVHARSCHPPPVLRAIPLAQFIRVARACLSLNVVRNSNNNNNNNNNSNQHGDDNGHRHLHLTHHQRETAAVTRFWKAARVLFRRFTLRGYSLRLLRSAAVLALSRCLRGGEEELLQPAGGGGGRCSSSNRQRVTTTTSTTSSSSSTTGQKRPFRLVHQYDGAPQRRWRFITRLLNDTLRSAANFYERQGTGGESLASMFANSRAAVTFRGRPRLMKRV